MISPLSNAVSSTGRRKSGRKKSSRSPGPAWLRLLLVAVLLIGVGGLGLVAWSNTPEGQAALLRLGVESRFGAVQQNLEYALAGVLPDLADAGDGAAGDTWHTEAGQDSSSGIRCRLVACDPGRSFWETQAALAEAVEAVGGQVLWSERLPSSKGSDGRSARSGDDDSEVLRLDVGVSSRPTHTLVLYREGTRRPDMKWGRGQFRTAWDLLSEQQEMPTVALVIDDWGNFENETTDGLLALDVPLTVAVMPGLPFSRRFALAGTELALPADTDLGKGSPMAGDDPRATSGLRRQRLARGCPVDIALGSAVTHLPDRRREIWLHLPMEPEGYPEVNPGAGALLVGMSRREIDAILDRALAGLPGARGLNNHMGSRVTADRPTMKRLMASLAGRDLLFLDSLTTSHSVAAEVAGEAGLPVLRSRIFLDQANASTGQVRHLLGRLVNSARNTGFAVAIGHPYPETLAVLKAEVPRLKAEGIRFVTISEFQALRQAVIAD